MPKPKQAKPMKLEPRRRVLGWHFGAGHPKLTEHLEFHAGKNTSDVLGRIMEHERIVVSHATLFKVPLPQEVLFKKLGKLTGRDSGQIKDIRSRKVDGRTVYSMEFEPGSGKIAYLQVRADAAEGSREREIYDTIAEAYKKAEERIRLKRTFAR